ncbi:hypothetical protein HKD37_16G046338 [Glycine soja]
MLSSNYLRNRVMNTKRIILSPFTKEYRVFVTQSGIRLFLEEHSNGGLCNFSANFAHLFVLLLQFETQLLVVSVQLLHCETELQLLQRGLD